MKDLICNMRKHNVHSDPLRCIVCSATTPPQHHHTHTSVCEQRLPHAFSRSMGDNRCHTKGGHIMLHICLPVVVGGRGAWQQSYWCTHDEPTLVVARGPGTRRHGIVCSQGTGVDHGVHMCPCREKPVHGNTCVVNKMLLAENCE